MLCITSDFSFLLLHRCNSAFFPSNSNLKKIEVIDLNIANGDNIDFASYGFKKILFVSAQPKSNSYTYIAQNAIQTNTSTTFNIMALVNGTWLEAGANPFRVLVIGE